ncbi:hypothetical protein [Streptomyces phytophilus]|uniref:hypothetical protein n=1 Tax=Streptomyces phytophilus TaxID=722715 RepID=UPI0015F0DA81|nr:hypothetical protein [Streptomyces phytophilus]
MSTRGFISFAVNGATKTAYNHHDSYPDGLGLDVLRWAREADLGAAKTAAQALRVVTDVDEPTDEDIERLAPFTNRTVGGRRERPDWYQLLRETQGSPARMLQAGVIGDASEFPADSLFAEWGYVVDFDAQNFEVYEGFQKRAHTEGRFASPESDDNGYYPVRLIRLWPLTALPDDRTFVAELEGEDGGSDDR